MAKLARLPANDRAPEPDAAEPRPIPHPQTRYYAFLSYSHKDQELADWLHRELERFRVPHALAGKLTANGVIPRRLTPIFRDEHELAAGDLAEEIKAALSASQFLIVLCSPDAAKSRWTNEEIEEFKRTRPEACVLAAIASGEPFASEMPGREDEECFPAALMQKYDRRGRPTGRRAEPLAADLRGDDDQRRQGFLKLVAGMLGVGLDELVQRETTRRQRRLAWLAAASLAGMAVTSSLAVAAIESRNSAREQRREAEGLVGFMLGDLKDKLEPIGKLDALDGVGSRVLAYYSKQNTSELSDAALVQRSRALSLTAEVANLRGDLNGAQKLYREAAAGTAEAVRRSPSDPQRLFDHAQNIYYFGDLAAQRGQFDRAEAAFREYRGLADRMVAIEPDNLKWRMEEQYAEANLGIVLLKQRRFAEAANQFAGALQTIEAVTAVDPRNRGYQTSVPESLAWLADAEIAMGKVREATIHRQRQIALLESLSQKAGGDVEYRKRLIPAHLALGRLLAAQGQGEAAEQHLKAAVSIAEGLIPEEPSNSKWLEYGANAQLSLAQHLLGTGRLADAAAEARAGCDVVERRVSREAAIIYWRYDYATCLDLRAQLAMARGDPATALTLATKQLALTSALKSGDSTEDRFIRARVQRQIGDINQIMGNDVAARAAWHNGLAEVPANASERPWESGVRADLLSRLGDAAGARRINAHLADIGITRPGILKG